jgi:hypothetical protein
MNPSKEWKTKTLFIGTVVGALTGLFAGYLLVKRAEQTQQKPQLNAGDGVKIGLSILGVLKLISELVEHI